MYLKTWTSWKRICWLCASTACMSLLTGCWSERPISFSTGQDYIVLAKGQTYTASRDVTLATESVIQRKDETILGLIKVNEQLLKELQLKKGD